MLVKVRLKSHYQQFRREFYSEMHSRLRQSARIVHGRILESMQVYATGKAAMAKHAGKKFKVYTRGGGGRMRPRNAAARSKKSRGQGFVWVQAKTRREALHGHTQVVVGPGKKLRTTTFSRTQVRAFQSSQTDLYFPSRPGEVPHIRTGALKKSIFWQYTPNSFTWTARVGASAKHALWLEKGTRRMAARPFIIPALIATQTLFGRVLVAPIPGM